MTTQRRARRGSQAIEFALVLPVLLAVTSGIVDYGWYYSQALSVIYAAREGGRTGAAHDFDDTGTPCSIAETATINALKAAGFSTASASQVAGSVTTDSGTGELVLSVTATIPYTKLWGLLPTPTNMVGRITVRLEDQDNGTCTY